MKLIYIAYSPLDLQSANSIQTFATCRALAAQWDERLLVIVPRFSAREATPPFPVARIPRIPLNKLSRLWRTALWSVLERTVYAWLARHYLARRGIKTTAVYCRDIICAYWLVRAGLPVIYEVHDLEARHPSKMKGARLARWLERIDERTLRGARAVVSLTETFKQELLARAWQPAENIFVIPDAYAAEIYYPRARDQMRAKFGLPPEALIVTYAGMTFAYRGLDILLKAFSLWNEPRARLYLLGGRDAEIVELRQQARVLGLDDALIFTGRLTQAQTAEYLSAADILVIPGTVTDTTASPLKMFEYMALARAIVAVDRPALREILVDGSAEFFRAGDAADLARALRQLAESEERRNCLAAQAHARVQEFSYAARAKKIREVVEAVNGRANGG